MHQQQMTIDEHKRAAELLVSIEGQLDALLALISDRQGVRARLLDDVLKAERVLSLVRSRLEDVMFEQHRGERVNTEVYYPDPTRQRIFPNTSGAGSPIASYPSS